MALTSPDESVGYGMKDFGENLVSVGVAEHADENCDDEPNKATFVSSWLSPTPFFIPFSLASGEFLLLLPEESFLVSGPAWPGWRHLNCHVSDRVRVSVEGVWTIEIAKYRTRRVSGPRERLEALLRPMSLRITARGMSPRIDARCSFRSVVAGACPGL